MPAPASPIARQSVTSSWVISSASLRAVSARSAGSRGRSAASMRCTAQERFTAVGRALRMRSAAGMSAAFSGFS